MSQALRFLRETHMLGLRCREQMVHSKHFAVLKNGPFLWMGHGVLRPPYRMVRLESPNTHVYATIRGQGRALVAGREVELGPGSVLVTPAGAHYAYEVAGDGPWETAWVFFDDAPGMSVTRLRETVVLQSEVQDFAQLLRMLTQEAAGLGQPSVLESLVSLLDTCTRRMAGIDEVDMRLLRVWNQVEAELSRDWDCKRLARLACMSEEHLRRLCQKGYQASPMSHLTALRMRRAGALLRSSPAKLEDIAQQVGYGSVYSFSAAFRRWSGVPPARYRRGES